VLLCDVLPEPGTAGAVTIGGVPLLLGVLPATGGGDTALGLYEGADTVGPDDVEGAAEGALAPDVPPDVPPADPPDDPVCVTAAPVEARSNAVARTARRRVSRTMTHLLCGSEA
jgi:hypothetical protein